MAIDPAELAQRLAQLSPEQRALVEKRLQARSLDLEAASAASDSRASFGQERLWFINTLDPGAPAYNIPEAFHIQGELDTYALEQAVREVVHRHAALRTGLCEVDGTLRQVVVSSIDIHVELEQVESLDAAIAAANELGGRPFDLREPPLLRIKLYEIAPLERLMLVVVHHAVCDGASLTVLFRELTTAYAHACGVGPALLPPPSPIQYLDFASWQRRKVEAVAAKQTEYWLEALAGAAQTSLPTTSPQPAFLGFAGALESRVLPSSLISDFTALCRTEGSTLFMGLLTVFDILLARLSGSGDVVVGTSVTARSDQRLESIIGFFANTLPIRVRFGLDETFRAVLSRVKLACIDAYSNDELPLQDIVKAAAPPRLAGRPPLLQTVLNFDLARDATALDLPGVSCSPIDIDPGKAKFDLMLEVRGGSDEQHGLYCEYRTDLYARARARRMLEEYDQTLRSAIANPDVRCSQLEILPRHQRIFLAEVVNDTAVPLRGALLTDLVQEKIDQLPDATAVASGDREVTYAGLDAAATRIASALRRRMIGRGAILGIHGRWTPDLVAAVLGILRAGAAYLPLGTATAERIAEIAARAPLALVILQDRDTTTSSLPVATVTIDELLTDGTFRKPVPPVPLSPHDLAYVISTSGSTGPPKLIAVTHGGAANNICDLNRRLGVRSSDSVLATSAPTFDLSVYDTLGILAAGGSMVLPDPATADDPRHWLDLIVRHRITIWNSAPALAILLLEARRLRPTTSLDLRIAMLGGDWIPPSLAAQLTAAVPGLNIAALGGATEASIHSLLHTVERDDLTKTMLPYGRPLGNQRAYVVDERSQLLPIDTPGELCLAGAGLSTGYLGDARATAERFVPDPFAGGGARMFRTRDRAYCDEYGIFHILGRMDTVIKVHGIRVDLSEIESELQKTPGVADGVAVVRRQPNVIVAFVRPSPSVVLSPKQVARDLRGRLPRELMPAEIMIVNDYPLTLHGKIDRIALSTSVLSSMKPRARTTEEVSTNDDDLDRRLAQQWAEILGRPSIGLDENFFETGGDSLLAIRAAVAAGEATRVADIIRYPTVRELADKLREDPTADPLA